MFQTLLEIFPYYFAWVMAVILLVNVRNGLFTTLIYRFRVKFHNGFRIQLLFEFFLEAFLLEFSIEQVKNFSIEVLYLHFWKKILISDLFSHLNGPDFKVTFVLAFQFIIQELISLFFVQRSYGKPCLACTVALIGVFEFTAKIYYGDATVEPLLNAALTLFPSNYTLGEALKALRYGMPIILQGALLMMDNSFDSITNQPENPTQILENIVAKQKSILGLGSIIAKGFKNRSKEENADKIKKFYDQILDFNRVELAAGIAESMDEIEKKEKDQSIFVKIFKSLLGVSVMLGMVNYILFGPAGFKLPKYQNMQSASQKK